MFPTRKQRRPFARYFLSLRYFSKGPEKKLPPFFFQKLLTVKLPSLLSLPAAIRFSPERDGMKTFLIMVNLPNYKLWAIKLLNIASSYLTSLLCDFWLFWLLHASRYWATYIYFLLGRSCAFSGTYSFWPENQSAPSFYARPSFRPGIPIVLSLLNSRHPLI